MSALAIAAIVFGFTFGGALVGIVLQSLLPQHHLSSESRSVVGLGMGLVGTMTALMLGLLIASAQGTYVTQRGEVTQMAANVLLLDRLLAHYGDDAKSCRDMIRATTVRIVDQIWSNAPATAPFTRAAGGDRAFDCLENLVPHTDAQRSLQTQALSIAIDIGQLRALMMEQRGNALPSLFIEMIVFWVTVIFLSFGLFAPRNATVIATLLVCALSVAGAILIVLELYRPFGGLIQIPRASLEQSLSQLDR